MFSIQQPNGSDHWMRMPWMCPLMMLVQARAPLLKGQRSIRNFLLELRATCHRQNHYIFLGGSSNKIGNKFYRVLTIIWVLVRLTEVFCKWDQFHWRAGSLKLAIFNVSGASSNFTGHWDCQLKTRTVIRTSANLQTCPKENNNVEQDSRWNNHFFIVSIWIVQGKYNFELAALLGGMA